MPLLEPSELGRRIKAILGQESAAFGILGRQESFPDPGRTGLRRTPHPGARRSLRLCAYFALGFLLWSARYPWKNVSQSHAKKMAFVQ